ncbi:MAG: hypothetical protein AB8G77_06930 [Rhodothermales bacterium]
MHAFSTPTLQGAVYLQTPVAGPLNVSTPDLTVEHFIGQIEMFYHFHAFCKMIVGTSQFSDKLIKSDKKVVILNEAEGSHESQLYSLVLTKGRFFIVFREISEPPAF